MYSSRGRRLPFVLSAIILMVAASMWGCSSAVQLAGLPRAREGAVDGRPTEWQEGMQIFQDQGIEAGVQNDHDNLYICLRAFERNTARGILVSGLTVWFDHKNGADEKWGIRFPVGVAGSRGGGDREPMPEPEDEAMPDPSRLESRVRESLADLEILDMKSGQATRVSTLTSNQEYGIQVAIRDSLGILTYELKVPRRSTTARYALGEISDGIVGVEVETNAINRQALQRGGRGPGEEARPSGAGGRSGGRGGGRGGNGWSAPGTRWRPEKLRAAEDFPLSAHVAHRILTGARVESVRRGIVQRL